MEKELFEQQFIFNPFQSIGLDYPLLYINGSTIVNTWLVLLLLTALILVCRSKLGKKNSVLRYMIISGVHSFMNLVQQTMGFFNYSHFAFVFSIFIFILLCNCVAIIPWTTEPTKDINTTLAFGLISFFYKEVYGIKAHGIKAYIQEFLKPFFLMLPINIIGHFSKIVSISFRLFGNIFGGAIIMDLYHSVISSSVILELIGLLSGINFIILGFFGIFEGLIQAFVFAMLTLTYLALAIQSDATGESHA
jgi:F-type H+-transporting ATPase subunit a